MWDDLDWQRQSDWGIGACRCSKLEPPKAGRPPTATRILLWHCLTLSVCKPSPGKLSWPGSPPPGFCYPWDMPHLRAGATTIWKEATAVCKGYVAVSMQSLIPKKTSQRAPMTTHDQAAPGATLPAGSCLSSSLHYLQETAGWILESRLSP